ncbi:MAG: hypothetical protein GY792_37110, partial [Gammaproteobacteria bacterium]|nr:hypothetical protein [Gammaproteobacteria bacterium]
MTKAAHTAQATIFDNIEERAIPADEFLFDEYFEDEAYELDLSALLGFEEVPILLVDTDPERAVSRQKEMMEACFGGIGREKKPEKRMGLAMQQLDVEQRHALRLLLIYQDPEALTTHLTRCLADPEYGYGERGYNGRTIAQAMAAISGDDLAGIVTGWLTIY